MYNGDEIPLYVRTGHRRILCLSSVLPPPSLFLADSAHRRPEIVSLRTSLRDQPVREVNQPCPITIIGKPCFLTQMYQSLTVNS